MVPWLVVICLLLILTLVITYQIFLFIEDKVLFDPSVHHVWTPQLPYQDVMFGSSLHGWLFVNTVKPDQPRSPLVLYCHGNTGNISHRRYVVDLCQSMQLSLFLFDYRGYGRSKGRSTLKTLKQDGDEAYRYIESIGYLPHDIIVWGESLGGLVATDIAARHQCRSLLLMATFADLASLSLKSKRLIGRFAYPFLYFQGESNLRRIKTITAPTLIVHSFDDEIIPYSQGQDLYEHIPHTNKKLISIHGGHGTPHLTVEDVKAILLFCQHNVTLGPKCLDILTYIGSMDHKHG